MPTISDRRLEQALTDYETASEQFHRLLPASLETEQTPLFQERLQNFCNAQDALIVAIDAYAAHRVALALSNERKHHLRRARARRNTERKSSCTRTLTRR